MTLARIGEGHDPIPPATETAEWERRRLLLDAVRQLDPNHLFCDKCLCCSADWQECELCGGEGETAPGQLHDEDPLWYDLGDTEPCHQCNGESRWLVCLGACWKAPVAA